MQNIFKSIFRYISYSQRCFSIYSFLIMLCTCCSLISTFSLWAPPIPSDIPYLQAAAVSPVVYSLFLLQHDLMCLSDNKRQERKRRGQREGGEDGEDGRPVSQTVQDFLCYLFSMWEKSIPPSLLSSCNDKDGPDYSSLHKGKLIPRGCVCVCDCMCLCVCVSKAVSSSLNSAGNVFYFFEKWQCWCDLEVWRM